MNWDDFDKNLRGLLDRADIDRIGLKFVRMRSEIFKPKDILEFDERFDLLFCSKLIESVRKRELMNFKQLWIFKFSEIQVWV